MVIVVGAGTAILLIVIYVSRRKNNDHQSTNGTYTTPPIAYSKINRNSQISAEGPHFTAAPHTLDKHTVDSTSTKQDTQSSSNENSLSKEPIGANYVQKMDSNINDSELQKQATDNYNPTTPERIESNVDPA